MKRLVLIAPYGFTLDGSTEPREQEALAIIRDGRARGVSFPKLAAELNARGFRTRGGKPFYRSAVFWIATNLEE